MPWRLTIVRGNMSREKEDPNWSPRCLWAPILSSAQAVTLHSTAKGTSFTRGKGRLLKRGSNECVCASPYRFAKKGQGHPRDHALGEQEPGHRRVSLQTTVSSSVWTYLEPRKGKTAVGMHTPKSQAGKPWEGDGECGTACMCLLSTKHPL